jgi:hypothetical protein
MTTVAAIDIMAIVLPATAARFMATSFMIPIAPRKIFSAKLVRDAGRREWLLSLLYWYLA